MKYPKLRELKEAVVSVFTPAYTTKFPEEGHVPPDNFRGKPVVDDDNCVGCLACSNVCPAKAILVFDDAATKTRIIERNYGRCIFCGQCASNCITGTGVKLSNTIYDLSTFNQDDLVEKQHKELLVCEFCEAVITTPDHIKFMHSKLGPKAFASILNLNMLNEKLRLAGKDDIKVEVVDELKRKDMFNVICPNCMRKIQVKLLT